MNFLTRNIESNTGYFILEWEMDLEEAKLFQKSKNHWHSVYEGKLNQISFSGLSDGNYEYAVCASREEQPQSSLCDYTKVKVQHYSLHQTVFSLGIGLCLFLSIVLVLSYFLTTTKSRGAKS